MNLNIVKPLADYLYKVVHRKYTSILSVERIPIPTKVDPLWRLINGRTNELYFNELIARNSGMPYDYLYKKILHEAPKGVITVTDEIGQEKVYYGWGFRDYYLEVLLDFLEIKDGRVVDRFFIFCNDELKSANNDTDYINEEIIKTQFDNVWSHLQNTNSNSEKVDKEIYNDILQESKKLRSIYIPKLKNTNWYFYFHDNDANRGEIKEGAWLLVQLVFKFLEEQNGDIKVEIINTKGPIHNDYRGRTEFVNSSDNILSIICKTYPFYSRLLNLRLSVGEGDGNLFLGQYLNQETDNHIVSGNFVLEKIEAVSSDSDLLPKVYHIPTISEEDFYKVDHHGISQYIIQYLRDKEKSLRRTPFSKKYNIDGLADWLEKNRRK
ncbi:hypothetical protein IC229_28985 [Spirosoma sp. BT702]|uniref:Uncharacterized protein n=1 Tax=Spirosoma profusum TaxID=2771354 RepID=A0A927G9M3_9BACT|nr:hypothetical protein [Spirosoma profusum]MBD2704706.1 hypothetical protein [Spirosoma profusum]